LKALRFEDGYGVDVGLLIDASLSGARVAEVDIGSLEHDSQALEDLTLMANEVGRVIFQRARSAGRLHVDQILAMYEVQRQATSSISFIMSRRKARKRLLLLDLDGTVTQQNFFAELALATGHQQEYRDALERVAEGSNLPLRSPHADRTRRAADCDSSRVDRNGEQAPASGILCRRDQQRLVHCGRDHTAAHLCRLRNCTHRTV
jgi:hypothetical protein